MLKVSITLPGDMAITFEASEPEHFREMLELALKELPKELMQIQTGEASAPEPGAGGKNVNRVKPGGDIEEKAKAGTAEPSPPEKSISSGAAEEAFAGFCASLSPLGDMRRVVVSAEGARRFLGMERVSENELGRLFQLAGWRLPAEFIQALRNAARSKYNWLERVPGAPGYYSVSETGRQRVLTPGGDQG